MGGRREDRGVMTHHETQWQSFSIFQLSTSWIHVCCCFVSCWLKSEDLSLCDVLTRMSDLLNKVVSPAICQSPWLCLGANIITDGLMVPGLLCPERWIISHPGLVWLFLQVWRLFWWVVIFIFIWQPSQSWLCVDAGEGPGGHWAAGRTLGLCKPAQSGPGSGGTRTHWGNLPSSPSSLSHHYSALQWPPSSSPPSPPPPPLCDRAGSGPSSVPAASQYRALDSACASWRLNSAAQPCSHHCWWQHLVNILPHS